MPQSVGRLSGYRAVTVNVVVTTLSDSTHASVAGAGWTWNAVAVRRLVLVTCLVVSFSLVGSPVSGSQLPQRTHETRGWMYAQALNAPSPGSDQIQVLVRLCERPRREKECRRMSPSLMAHIGAESEPPILWVHRMWPHAGTYWVLSPIRFGSGRAEYRYKWRETDENGGCAGRGVVRFLRALDSWDQTGHSGVIGCPAA
jgi:hypothetical protein